MILQFSTELTAADTETRTITGRIVTWEEVGSTSQGPTRFAKDSISFENEIKLLREHDRSTPLGRATRIQELTDGLEASFRIVKSTAGNDALVEASEQLRDGLSVGVEVLESEFDADGTLIVTASRLDEISLVHTPAIDSARVTTVAASEKQTNEGAPMTEENTVEIEEAVLVEASRPAPVAVTRPRVEFSGPGDYLATYISAGKGDHDSKSRIQAALSDNTISDNPGIVPEQIVGDVIGKEYGSRPIKDSARNLPMPSYGATFTRPMISQNVKVGAQGSELSELATRTMEIDPVTVTKVTYGGALKLSYQDIAWTDPAIMSIVTSDLVRQYAEVTETALATALVAGATGTELLPADAKGGATVAAIYAAAASVNSESGVLPDTIWASPDQWARLGSMMDDSGRPLFPTLAPSNAPGTASADAFSMNPVGLRLVVSSNLAEGSLIVGASRYFEVFENVGGALSATHPDVLGTTVAYYGFMAQLVTLGGAFVKLGPAATRSVSK